MKLGAALNDDDGPGPHEFPAEPLHAEVLGIRVAPVARGADALLMSHAGPLADLHVGDFDFGEVLPVPSVAAIAGAAREPEDPDLLVLAVPHDLGSDLGTLDVWLAALHFLPVARDQHVVERHLVARLRIEQRDLDRDSRLGPKLTAAGRENRVTHRARNLNRHLGLVKRPRTARSRPGQRAAPSS